MKELAEVTSEARAWQSLARQLREDKLARKRAQLEAKARAKAEEIPEK